VLFSFPIVFIAQGLASTACSSMRFVRIVNAVDLTAVYVNVTVLEFFSGIPFDFLIVVVVSLFARRIVHYRTVREL